MNFLINSSDFNCTINSSPILHYYHYYFYGILLVRNRDAAFGTNPHLGKVTSAIRSEQDNEYFQQNRNEKGKKRETYLQNE